MDELRSAREILETAFLNCRMADWEAVLLAGSVLQELTDNGYDFGYHE